jgi:hypothetical protein
MKEENFQVEITNSTPICKKLCRLVKELHQGKHMCIHADYTTNNSIHNPYDDGIGVNFTKSDNKIKIEMINGGVFNRKEVEYDYKLFDFIKSRLWNFVETRKTTRKVGFSRRFWWDIMDKMMEDDIDHKIYIQKRNELIEERGKEATNRVRVWKENHYKRKLKGRIREIIEKEFNNAEVYTSSLYAVIFFDNYEDLNNFDEDVISKKLMRFKKTIMNRK